MISFYQTMYYQNVIIPGKQKRGLKHISEEDIEQHIIVSEESVGSKVGTSRKLDQRIASYVAKKIFDYFISVGEIDKDGNIQPTVDWKEQYRFKVPGIEAGSPAPAYYDEYTAEDRKRFLSQFKGKSGGDGR